jgi:glycosyltransferase involved in cell wall biosynthesis
MFGAIRVLVMTPYPALPLSHGGRVRTFQLARGLVRAGAQVDLVCPWSPGQPRGDYAIDGVRVRPKLFPTSPLLALPDDWLPSALPISWEARAGRARSLLREAASYDIAQFEVSGQAPWAERVPAGVRKVYASHNVDADFDLERGTRGGALRRRMAGRVGNMERRLVAESDLVVACTEGDAESFRTRYGASVNTAVVPNGFDDELLALDRGRLRARQRRELGLGDHELLLLFIGGGAEHNRRAVQALERDVLPAAGRPVRLAVVGKAAAALSDRDTRVISVGYAEDLNPWFAAADVGLNPVAYGSGSNLKVAEYLAAGLPVLTTPVGSRGFERWTDRMRIAEIEDFAGALASIPGVSAPPSGIEDLAWSGLGKRLHALYADLL